MDPDAFRRSLNTCVQELRNISFLVQKEKGKLPNFDSWYPEWTEAARIDPKMRWIVESRNRIVKQGDLDLLSKMRVRYHLDWAASAEVEVKFPPGTPILLAARQVFERMGTPPFGMVTVKRRWTDYSMPGVELLDALATAYGRCAELLDRAHKAAGIDDCGITPAIAGCSETSRLPDCMANAAQWTEASIDAKTGEVNSLRHYIIERSDEGQEEAVQRYGEQGDLTARLSGADALGAVDVFIEMGRRILAVDSDLMTQCVYFKGDELVHMEGGKPQDHFGKVLWADQIASTAINTGATSVLISADVWEAPMTHTGRDVVPVSKRPDKTEALSVAAVSIDGRSLLKRLRYSRREDGTADFGEVVVDRLVARYLEPLRKAWGIAAWTHAT